MKRRRHYLNPWADTLIVATLLAAAIVMACWHPGEVFDAAIPSALLSLYALWRWWR